MTEADPLPAPRSRTRKRLAIGVAALVLVGAVGAGGYFWLYSARPSSAAVASEPASTTTVVRTDLTEEQELGGTIGFGAEQTVKGRKAGTVTWLPAAGTEVDRGKPLYKVDAKPVPLFFGDTPLFRRLETAGTRGPDVKVVRENLAALGFKDTTRPLDTLTDNTINAIKRWQKANGVEETGVLDVGEVLVLPGKVRVNALRAQLGAAADAELMTITSTTRAVTAAVDAGSAAMVKPGGKVIVLLPNGSETPGVVASVGRVAQASAPEGGPEGPAKIQAVVTLEDAGAASQLDSTPVRVRVTTVAKQNVLAVPVGALLALREGGYGLQLAEGNQTRMVAAKVGTIAKGMAEVTGPDVREGLRVVTTS